MNRTVIILLAVMLLAAGCSGSAAVSDRTAPQPGTVAPADQLFADGARLDVVRNTAGAPTGIALTWTSVDDTDTSGPYITGYHVYKSASPIPDTARGDDSLWVDFGGDPLVPQAAVPGDPLGPVTDLFAAEYGQTWYYRLTAVASDGDESRLSPEAQIDVAPFEITSVAPTALGVGDQFTISGLNFGEYDAAGDLVEVRGVIWEDGTGFVPALLEAPVVPGMWTPTSIVCTLPLGATTGPVDLTIAGLTVTSVDVLTNTDPYITSLSPLAATIEDIVTLEGANFGAAGGPDNHVVFGGVNLDDPADYDFYGDSEIRFFPRALGEFIAHEVQVESGGVLSNTGFCELLNLPPVAFLTGNPADGLAPLDVVFRPARLVSPVDWEYSYDPDGVIAEYRYDFDGDGTDDATLVAPDDVTHNYPDVGEYFARLTVVDDQGLEGTAEFRVEVRSTPLVLTLLSNPPPGQYFADTPEFTMRYSIEGGTAPVDIDWTLIDAKQPTNEYLLATDSGLAQGAEIRSFILDTGTDVVTPGSGVIPRGSWQLRAQATDADPFNDPDGRFVMPTDAVGVLGQWDIYRLNVGVISDDQADISGVEGANFISLLNSAGYLTTYYPTSGAIDPAQIATHHAAIWATEGPFGTSLPFEWLTVDEQTIIMVIEDLGCDVIIFGVPNVPSLSNPVFGFPPFNDLYQPFSTVDVGTGPQTLATEDFTTTGAFGDFLVQGFDTGVEFGSCFTPLLFPGSTSQSMFTLGPDPFSVAASRTNPTGTARMYFGMYIFSKTTSLTPAGATPEQLLDNIVTGTVF